MKHRNVHPVFAYIGFVLLLLGMISHHASSQDIRDLDKMSTNSRKKTIAGQDVYYYKGGLAEFKQIESGVMHWLPDGVYLEKDRTFYQQGGRFSSDRFIAFRNANIRVVYNGTVTLGKLTVAKKNTSLSSELRNDIQYGDLEFHSCTLLDPLDFSRYRISGRLSIESCRIDSSASFSKTSKYTSVAISRTSIPNLLLIDSITIRDHLTVEQTDSICRIVVQNAVIGESFSSTDGQGLNLRSLANIKSLRINNCTIRTGSRIEDVSSDSLILDDCDFQGNAVLKNIIINQYGRLHERSFRSGYDLSLVSVIGVLDVYLNAQQQQRFLYRYKWDEIRSGRLRFLKEEGCSEQEYQSALSSLYNNLANEYRKQNDDMTAKEITERLRRILRERAGGFQHLINILFPEYGVPPALWILIGLWLVSIVLHLCFSSTRHGITMIYEWNFMNRHHPILFGFAVLHHSAGIVFGIRYKKEWIRDDCIPLTGIGVPVWFISKVIYSMALLFAVQNAPFLDFIRTWFA